MWPICGTTNSQLIHRKMFFSVVLFLGVIEPFSSVVTGERLHEQIYSSIEGGAACFRRLNGTHQAGCTSSDKGAVGIVQMINTVNDAEWLTLNASAGQYVAVVRTSLFYDTIELFMKYPNNIAGILIYVNITASKVSYTQESRCPNEYASDPNSQCSSSETGGIVWNEKGTGLLKRDIPFPIFFLPQSRFEEVDKIENCYNRFNLDRDNQKGRPLCSLQLSSFMYAAVNTEVCLRRSASTTFLTPTKVCDPLGDNNVYYSLFPRAKETEDSNKSVTLVTARIDAASLFDGLSPGAASSVVGMVSLITAASLLAKMIPLTDAPQYKHNIMWTLFNGEAFDYIGSQRVAYDLSRGAWPPNAPLPLSLLRLHVEIGQLGGSFLRNKDNVSWPFYAFAPYTSAPPQEVTEFLAEMSTNLNQNKMSITPKLTMNLPPSSLHSFRRILKNVTDSGELPEIVVADHEEIFTNMFYNSAMDDYDNVGFLYHNITIDSNGTFIDTDALIANGTMKETEIQVKIARFASALSNTLYQRVVGTPYTGTIKASAHLVDEMLYCFLKSQACQLLSAADYASSSDEDAPERPASLYVSVASWPGTPAVFAGHLLALLAGVHLPANRSACDGMKDANFSYYWLRGWNHTGVCIQTTMNFTQAISPAFTIQGYDLSSGEYSTWTESVWQAMWVRLFVAAGGGGARAAAITGAVATALVACATYWLKRHSELVFITSPAVSINADASAGILRTVNC